MTLPKTSTFTVYDNPKEVEHLIKVAKNMGYKYTVKIKSLAGCDTNKTETAKLK